MPGKSFLKGPIPLPWLAAAFKTGGAAAAAGLYLWYLRGLRKTSEDLIVTRKGALAALGIKKDTLRRGLIKLEVAGLITITRGRGKAIRATLIKLEEPSQPNKPLSVPAPREQPVTLPEPISLPAPGLISTVEKERTPTPTILLKSLTAEVVRRTSPLPEEVRS